MISSRTVTLTALGLVLLSSFVLAEPGSAGRWETSLESAQAKGKELNKPVLVHFYADWCGPCKTMEATVFRAGEFQAVLGRDVIGVKVDGDRHAGLRSRYGINAYPADVLISPEGKELDRSLGSLSLAKYISFIEESAAPFRVAETTTPTTRQDEIEKPTQPVKTVLKVKRSRLGMEGYSPVALVQDSRWSQGNPLYQETIEGVTYHFADAEELAAFKKQPGKFTPRYLGCDPIALLESNTAVAGRLKFGAVYEGRIYFMESEQNRLEFLKSPAKYAKLDYAIELDGAEEVVQTEEAAGGTSSM